MTESYDVAQQPKRMGMGLPIGLAAAGAAGGYFLQPKSGLSEEEVRKLFQSTDTVEIKNKLKSTSAENIDAAIKMQGELKELQAKLDAASKATLPADSSEAKALQRAKDALKAEIERLQGIENGKAGGIVGGKFPAKADFPAVDSAILDLKASEQKELKKLLKDLESAETGMANATTVERNALDKILKLDKTGNSGKLHTLYSNMIPDSQLKGLNDETLENAIKILENYEKCDASTGFVPKTSQKFNETRNIVADYYKKTQPVPTNPSKLNLEQAKGLSSYRELGRWEKINLAEGEVVAQTKDGIRYTYKGSDGVQFIKDETARMTELVDTTSKEVFGNVGEILRIRHKLQPDNLFKELSDYKGNGFINAESAKASGLTNFGKLDIKTIMNEKDAIKAMREDITKLTKPFIDDKQAIEKLRSKGSFDLASVKSAVKSGVDVSGCTTYDEVFEALAKARKDVKITDTHGLKNVTNGMKQSEVSKMIEARKGIIKQVEGEQKRLQSELNHLMKDNAIYRDAADRLSQKEAGFTKLSEIRQKILDKFGGMRLKEKGKTLAEMADVTPGTGKTITEGDVGKSFREAVENAQKAFDEAAAKGGKIDDAAKKAAQEAFDGKKKSFDEMVSKIGKESKVYKWFGGHKWAAAAIGGATLLVAGLAIRSSKNKQQA